MKLQITPIIALCDKEIEIKILGLPSMSRVTLKATMTLPWEESIEFESRAVFTTDENGILDLSKKAPDFGDYETVDCMGLISSLKLSSGNINKAAENISIDKSMFITISAECGEDTESVKLERLFIAPGVVREKISSPFVGEFFYTDNINNKTILMLGGSGGSLGANLPIASLLASHGFNVLTVAYFHEKGLPQNLAEIPLEYFDKVYEWLKNNQITAGRDLYLHCTSKGGELGLILASRNSDIKKVAAFAPHAYCFQGLNYKNVSSWTYMNRPLPYIRLKNSSVFAHVINCFIKNRPFGFTHVYRKSVIKTKNAEAARIRIENAKADILMFAGKEDNIWSAFDGCTEIMKTLNKVKYPYQYELITYEKAGHPFYAPYILPTSATTEVKIAPRIKFCSGGTQQDNAYAVADSWEKMINFFYNNTGMSK
jgi:dienelactone hydrolase